MYRRILSVTQKVRTKKNRIQKSSEIVEGNESSKSNYFETQRTLPALPAPKSTLESDEEGGNRKTKRFSFASMMEEETVEFQDIEVDNNQEEVEDEGDVDAGDQNGEQSKIEPMEIAPAPSEDEDDDDDEADAMESLLPGESGGTTGLIRQRSKGKPARTYLNGLIQPQPIGNMHVLFPEKFRSTGWGIVGPQWFGPICVWVILCVASHFCIRKAHHIGQGSVFLCYAFLAASTYFLTDVSLRDPGVCMCREIPASTPESEASQWRWCDFCQVFQPPDGAHCPDCNVCVAGYDHHCVWMGTCIGRKNHRQFVKFNISWLYYLLFATVWLSALGPLIMGRD